MTAVRPAAVHAGLGKVRAGHFPEGKATSWRGEPERSRILFARGCSRLSAILPARPGWLITPLDGEDRGQKERGHKGGTA